MASIYYVLSGKIEKGKNKGLGNTKMVINYRIIINDDRLLDGLSPVVKIMTQIESSSDSEIVIDFSSTRFVSPVFALSLIIYLSKCRKKVSLKNVPGYLELIGLCNGGIKPDQMRHTEFLAILEHYASKTYIPIINFVASQNSDAKEAISSLVENMIIRQLNIRPNVANGLKYMIDETLDNITEHSESERGYIFAQAYPKKGFLDVCIADRGVTLLGSYRKLLDNEITTDSEAIKAANRGLSSKNLPDAENRGFGIKTSKQMLIKGLDGQYLMISGGSLYVKSPKMDSFFSMPNGLRWNGTIVALRIPYMSSTFNYIDYLE